MDELARNLHDAVLLKIEHDWQSRTCKLLFRGAPAIGQPFHVEFHDVTGVELSALAPWGPSSSVLDVATGPGERVTITMQSGDILVVHSPNYSLKRTDQSLRD
ncbi:hypothetical protein V8J88_21360 [Massilia sp. W12]|uniref:hypothetical protein n=1 Tax=Massilia sp. W12 TaxID=3126507 RepID=UPI0030D5B73E